MLKAADRQTERTTLLAVATRAGVSVSTVSLVLSGKAGHRRIAEETRARVRRAAEDLNYAPNLLTRSLRRGRTHVLSFYSTFRHREEADVYMDTLSSAIEMAGGEAGYDILVHCNFNRSSKEIYQFLNGGLADGLILFAPQPNDPLLALLHKSSLPVVVLNGRDPARLFPSISDDVEAGMRIIAQELIAAGHCRIALFTAPAGEARDADIRIRLLRRYLEEARVPVPDRWLIPSGEDAREPLKSLMSEAEPPTAAFCWHDRLAYGVLASCEQIGIAIPNQLSVVGYDGLHWPSSTRHIAASIRVHQPTLARMAVRLLDDYINGYSGHLREEVLPVTFSPGTSLGPAVRCNGAIHE
ncbi:MAG: LacI family DNA-binding transcriptional regulator [Fimbriimonas sp.]|nr:LacI family DNA-binding transcriptional regulator [Fimbriimonas sp.]